MSEHCIVTKGSLSPPRWTACVRGREREREREGEGNEREGKRERKIQYRCSRETKGNARDPGNEYGRR